MSSDENYELLDPIDSSTVSVMPTALRYGGIGALIMIVLGLIIDDVLGLVDYSEQGGGMLNNLIFYGTIIGVVVLAIKMHRDNDLGGYISYGRSLGVGTLASLVLSIISSLWVYISFTFIKPGKLAEVQDAAMEQALEQAGGDEAALEATQGIMEMMFTPGMMAIMGILVTVITGFIIALIAGAILKKEQPGA